MKHNDAVKHLRALLFTLQRFRSISKEELAGGSWSPEVVQGVLEDLYPWVHSDKCPISVLVKALDDVDNGCKLDPLFFFNMVFIATRLQHELAFMVGYFGNDPDFPKEVDISWMRGWE